MSREGIRFSAVWFLDFHLFRTQFSIQLAIRYQSLRPYWFSPTSLIILNYAKGFWPPHPSFTPEVPLTLLAKCGVCSFLSFSCLFLYQLIQSLCFILIFVCNILFIYYYYYFITDVLVIETRIVKAFDIFLWLVGVQTVITNSLGRI